MSVFKTGPERDVVDLPRFYNPRTRKNHTALAIFNDDRLYSLCGYEHLTPVEAPRYGADDCKHCADLSRSHKWRTVRFITGPGDDYVTVPPVHPEETPAQ